ncbi:MAG: hypothetical protein JW895_02450 [Thermoleophilaceae bacterium]|nr:hypothetical protein [Thermoleophilaceae bacterium]
MRSLAKLCAGPVLALAGLNHFRMPRAYEAIMPDYVPAHRELVMASGVAETAAGLATMHPRTRRAGGLLGIATLIAIFPANVHMALHPERYRKIPPAALYARLPFQALFIWLVWRATLADDA